MLLAAGAAKAMLQSGLGGRDAVHLRGRGAVHLLITRCYHLQMVQSVLVGQRDEALAYYQIFSPPILQSVPAGRNAKHSLTARLIASHSGHVDVLQVFLAARAARALLQSVLGGRDAVRLRGRDAVHPYTYYQMLSLTLLQDFARSLEDRETDSSSSMLALPRC